MAVIISKRIVVPKIFDPDSTLNNNDWDTIRYASDNDLASSIWSVGDSKTITLNGTVVDTSFQNFSISVFIIGFNHNGEKEGHNTIHFEIGKVSGVSAALCSASYGNNSTGFQMNTGWTSTNSGGWEQCDMRKSILGNSGNPSSPVSGSFMSILPSDLRAVMKSVSKYTDNVGRASGAASSITKTTDYMFLLSEFEIFGSITYSNRYEQNSQQQYEYYKNGNSKIKVNHSAPSSQIKYAIRSPYVYDAYAFCGVEEYGSSYPYASGYNLGIPIVFVV